MKEKIIKLFKTKREIIILAAIMIVLLSTIILAAKLTSKTGGDLTVANIDENQENADQQNDDSNKKIDDNKTPVVPKKVVNAPIKGKYVNIRTFYDVNNQDTLNSSIIVNANSFKTSKGVSFSTENNEEFDCLAMTDGVVSKLEKTDMSGYVVEITNDNFVTTFYNLSSVNVKENDSITELQVIGKSGQSLYDTEIGNNVFVEIKVDNEYVNPLEQIGLLVEQVGRLEK